MNQKRFPEEFKIEAVRQIVERGLWVRLSAQGSAVASPPPGHANGGVIGCLKAIHTIISTSSRRSNDA